MTLGERIKIARKNKKMTQQELAQKLNTSKQTVCKYESGVISNLPLNRIAELAVALDVPPSYLMGWDNVNHTDNGQQLKNELDTAFTQDFKRLTPDEQKMVHAMITGLLNNRK